MTIWELMLPPLLECIVLVGIHSYLGIHVLKRKVIFVDLAFAQIAALGTTVAYLFQLHPDGPGAYVFSLLFTVMAAAVFAVTRLREERIPQEAVIGLTYALAAAFAILVIDRAPHGAEHIKDIMAGSILWVRLHDVAVAAAVYSGVGLFHFLFRDRFFLISGDTEEARAKGINVRLWDFLFYLSFGLVISVSVRVAGVLLVFVFLIVPAMIGVLLTDRPARQLLIGWGVGTAVSVLGLVVSHAGDFPAGPAVVTCYGAVLVCIALAVYLFHGRRGVAHWEALLTTRLRRLGIGALVVAAAAGALYLLGTAMTGSSYWRGGHEHEPSQEMAEESWAAAEQELDREDRALIEEVAAPAKTVPPEIATWLETLRPLDVTEKSETLEQLTAPALLDTLFGATDDPETRYAVAMRLSQLDADGAARALLSVMGESPVPIFRSDAADQLSEILGEPLAFDPFEEPDSPENAKALADLRQRLHLPGEPAGGNHSHAVRTAP